MDDLTLRPASAADVERIAWMVAGEPGKEILGMIGNKRLARRAGIEIVRLGMGRRGGWRETTVGEVPGKVVGMIQAGEGSDRPDVGLAEAWAALRILGPAGVLRTLPRLKSRERVQPKRPPDSYYVAEMHVDPDLRSRGIGGALLDHAETAARAGGYRRMALTTTTDNPARRLYERHGFQVVETLTDAAYERFTGIQGRHLMVKELT